MPARWPKKKTLCVCMPIRDTIEGKTKVCLSALQARVPPKLYNEHLRFGTYVDLSRSSIVNDIIGRGFDYLLWIDEDVVFTFEDVMRLVQAFKPKMGCLSGSYPFRDGSGRTTFGWIKEDGSYTTDQEATIRAIEHSKNGDIVPVDKLPAGFMLTTTETLRQLPAPTFACRWVNDELEDGTKVARFIGEDVYFAEILKSRGFTPSAHFGVQIGHIGKVAFGLMGSEILAQKGQPVG